jgi:hypothetical protein
MKQMVLSGKPPREQVPKATITPNHTKFLKDNIGQIRDRNEKQSSDTGLQTQVSKTMKYTGKLQPLFSTELPALGIPD